MSGRFKKIATGPPVIESLTDTQRCQRALEGLARRVGLTATEDPEDFLSLLTLITQRLDKLDEFGELLAKAAVDVQSALKEKDLLTAKHTQAAAEIHDLKAKSGAWIRQLEDFKSRYYDRYGRSADDDLKFSQSERMRGLVAEYAEFDANRRATPKSLGSADLPP